MRKLSCYVILIYYIFRPVLLIFLHLAFFYVFFGFGAYLNHISEMEPNNMKWFEITLIYAVGSSKLKKLLNFEFGVIFTGKNRPRLLSLNYSFLLLYRQQKVHAKPDCYEKKSWHMQKS